MEPRIKSPLLCALTVFLAIALSVLPIAAQSDDGGKTDFKDLVSPDERVVKLAGNMQFTEGPVWIADGGYLLFSDIQANVIRKWKDGKVTDHRAPSNNANGNLLDEQGRIVTCEHGSRTVTRTSKTGEVETLVADFEGKKFNSPNDLAIRSDGTIWFTDPPYGLGDRKRELPENNVFCYHPDTKKLMLVAGDFDRPNGVCLSPDEKKLYIADAGKPRHIRVFDVAADGSLSNGKVFCKIDRGFPDGIRCDQDGRSWSSADDGVHVFSPDGKLIGKIPVPETVSNLCFGGEDGKTLFITARTSLYSIKVKVTGAKCASSKPK
jgi:gluconolactonase